MATTTRQHIEMTRLDSSGNQYILYPKNTLKDVYTSATSGVTIEGKVNFFGTCATAADTAAKTVTISGFSLVAGAHVTVVFTNGISVANATLNVNSAGAKAIQYGGAALKANAIRANARVEMVYDGTVFHVISGAAEAPYVTNANTTKFYLTGTPTNESGVPTAEHFDTGVYVSTTSGQLVAGSFSGSGASLTNLNAGALASGTVPVERLATSGATAGTYGPAADGELAHSGTVKVPQVTVDAYGRITGCKDITLTMPAGLATDEKVKNELATTTKAYITGTTSATSNTGTQVFDTGVYLDTTAGRLTSGSMLTTTCYLGDTSSYINKTNYTGQAATVGTLSGYVVDSCASADANGVTAKALSANQGYLLQNQITTLNSNVSDIETAFQDGCDTIVAGCTTYGSTPTTNSPSAIVTSIKNIYTNRYNAGVTATKKGTAAAAQVLTGYTFTNSSSVGISGTMVNNGGTTKSATYSLDTTNSRVVATVPANAYYNTSSKLYATYSSVRTLIGLTAAKIVKGNTILGLAGTANTLSSDKFLEVCVGSGYAQSTTFGLGRVGKNNTGPNTYTGTYLKCYYKSDTTYQITCVKACRVARYLWYSGSSDSINDVKDYSAGATIMTTTTYLCVFAICVLAAL